MSNTRIAILGFEIPSVEEITPLLKKKRIIETPEPWLVKQGEDVVVNGCFKYVEHGVIYTAPVKDKKFKIYLRPKMMLGDAFEPSFGAKARQFGSLWSGTGKFFLLDNPIPVVFEKNELERRGYVESWLKNHFTSPEQRETAKMGNVDIVAEEQQPANGNFDLKVRHRRTRAEKKIAEITRVGKDKVKVSVINENGSFETIIDIGEVVDT